MESNPQFGNNSQAIETYIERVTELTQVGNRILSHEELLKIASELGISDSEIEIAQQQSQNHYIRAQSYYGLNHWDEAIEELENALAVNPFNLPMLHLLVKCYLGRWQNLHDRRDIELIRMRIKQCLDIQPDDQESIKLLAELDQLINNRKYRWFAISGVFVVSVGCFLGLFLSSNFSLPEVMNREDKLVQINEELNQQINSLRQEQTLLEQQLSGEIYFQKQINKELEFKIQELENQIDNLNAKQRELIKRIDNPPASPVLPENPEPEFNNSQPPSPSLP